MDESLRMAEAEAEWAERAALEADDGDDPDYPRLLREMAIRARALVDEVNAEGWTPGVYTAIGAMRGGAAECLERAAELMDDSKRADELRARATELRVEAQEAYEEAS